MPQIADLEIAATWDEIELEAALRGRGAEAPAEPSVETPSCLADALRAVEALKELPKEERKRRAEELLRALTSAPPALSPEAETPPEAPASPIVQESPSEPVAACADASAPSSSEPADPDGIAALLEATADVAAETIPVPAEPTPEVTAVVEPVALAAEISESIVETPPTDTAPEPEAPTPEAPVTAEPVAVSAESTTIEVSSPDEPVAASVEVSPEPLESAETIAAAPAPEPVASEEPPCATEVPVVTEVAPEAAAASAPIADRVVEAAPVAEPVVEAAPVVEPAPEPAAPPAVAPDPDAIPKFLTTECTALDPELPDSLIPFRAVAAAGALIGAVLLVYLWSSQEFGLAARPIIGGSETVQTHPGAPKIAASLAARQAFVALPPDFGGGPQSVRPHRPALVGFELFDDPAPTPARVTQADPAPASLQAMLDAPPPEPEPMAALPPAPSSDLSALIKRGDELLKAGDVAAARSSYERAAAQGNAKAQIGIGKTYDPLVLAKLGARGVRGDPVQAASWYARAGEAGDPEGQQRLDALISGLSDCMIGQGTCVSRKP